MRDELTQAELDEIFYGAKPVVEARFFSHEVIDVTASRAAGQRVMKVMPYVELKCEREKAYISRPAQPQDSHNHKAAWMAYQKEIADERPRQVPEVRPETTGDCEPLIASGYFKAQAS